MVKAIALVFSLLMAGVASAQTPTAASVQTPSTGTVEASSCKLPMYIQAEHGTADSTTSNGKLFLYGLRAAVTQHDGCIVSNMADAHLSLFINTMKIVNGEGQDDSSVISVALAVPLNGVPIYMDDYVMVIGNTDNVNGRVNDLLQSIGNTLDRYDQQNR